MAAWATAWLLSMLCLIVSSMCLTADLFCIPVMQARPDMGVASIAMGYPAGTPMGDNRGTAVLDGEAARGEALLLKPCLLSRLTAATGLSHRAALSCWTCPVCPSCFCWLAPLRSLAACTASLLRRQSHRHEIVPMPAAASLAAEGLEEQDPQATASAAEVEVQSAADAETSLEEAVQVRRRLLQCSTYSGHSQAVMLPALSLC